MTPEETAHCLACLFTTGENPMEPWHDLLEQAGGLARLARFSELELAQLFGLPAARARRLVAVFRVGREALLESPPPATPLCSPSEVFAYLAPRIGWPETEEFWVLGFNIRQHPLHLSLAAKGTPEQVSLSIGNVFRILLHHGAARGLVCHTHPSGDPSPSEADLVLTERIVQTGRMLGIPIIDHVILGQGGFSSLADGGYLSCD
ncbi:MAG: hypothetical protein CVU59_02030 [Deltaproteobacteria bacterium HGW-Deltaproteobacteria-17]|nr:MAG: hypothetical protein CVU59_02030 [Deltaproteobacteria bacterium HGW-Deltaproteobacteria-17]